MSNNSGMIVAGRNPVREALKSGRPVNKIFIMSNVSRGLLNNIKLLAKEHGVPVQMANKRRLDELAGEVNHQGIVATMASMKYVEVDELLARKPGGEPPIIVLLDEINDPRNFGAILRTAGAVGVSGIIIPQRRSVALTQVVAKTSAGAIEYVPVARVVNLARTIDYLKKCGLWVVGAHGESEHLYWDLDLNGPLAIAIGGEDKGLGRLIREKCDSLVKIPMVGGVGSLNASVAAALLFYEVLRQRRG